MVLIQGRRRARFFAGAAAALLVVVIGLLVLGSHLNRGYHPGPGDDRPPQDAAYHQAFQHGLAGDLQGGRLQMLCLAREQRGTNTAAWALYQAGLAARASGDAPGADAHFAQLLSEYPGHSLALRLQPDPPAPPPRLARKRPDCGPRSLLILCKAARIRASLKELARRCKTGTDGTTLALLADAARQKGFRVAAVQADGWFLKRHRPAGIAWIEGDHYIAFLPGKQLDEVRVLDPSQPGEKVVTADELARRASGIVLLVAWGKQGL